MNNADYEKPSGLSRQDLVIVKLSIVGCGLLLSIGLLVYAVTRFQPVSKAEPKEEVKPGDSRRDLTEPSEQSFIVAKKSQNPVIVEEGSEAYYCIQNNGGPVCLSRDRFAPNYKVIELPQPRKTYEDYLVQYGVRESGDCGRYFNGEPNCL